MKKSGLALVAGLALGFMMGFMGTPRVAHAAQQKAEVPPAAACCPAAANGCCGH